MDFLIQLIPTFIFLAFCLIPTWLIIKYYDFKNRKRKSPLNIKLLRSPGHSLRVQIDDITNDIFISLLFMPTMALLGYAVILQNLLNDEKDHSFLIALYIGIVALSTIYLSIKVSNLLKKRNKLRVGLECEIAVGQDLMQLMRHNFRIFHDFPADQFNIDHIAIGPTGVFAIETKGRSKFVKKEKKNWQVEFSGNTLHFPGWTETAPVEQARSQAKWLKNWLQQCTGEPIQVVPVLALPGWYIKITQASDVRIYNGKNSLFMTKGNSILTEKQIQRISHQIERECKDINALSYPKSEQNGH